MGTNYYRVKKISSHTRDLLQDKLSESISDSLINVDEYIELLKDVQSTHYVHICKSSAGWQICFDHNWGRFYQPNRKSLEDFLTEKYTYIVDEYGTKITPDEFWKIVDNHNKNVNNNWTNKTYREYEMNNGLYIPAYNSFHDKIAQCEEKFKVDCHGESDFTVDGLRFAVYSDFC